MGVSAPVPARGTAGTAVQLDFGSGGRWRLTRAAGGWELDEGTAERPAAALRMPPHLAWRQLTGLAVPDGRYTVAGDDRLAAPLLAVRVIIAGARRHLRHRQVTVTASSSSCSSGSAEISTPRPTRWPSISRRCSPWRRPPQWRAAQP